ncbi:uncharacterized, partial [Tachysurus ichikawai]
LIDDAFYLSSLTLDDMVDPGSKVTALFDPFAKNLAELYTVTSGNEPLRNHRPAKRDASNVGIHSFPTYV